VYYCSKCFDEVDMKMIELAFDGSIVDCNLLSICNGLYSTLVVEEDPLVKQAPIFLKEKRPKFY
jgi:hypothetical protein